jgi:hypothetical protein
LKVIYEFIHIMSSKKKLVRRSSKNTFPFDSLYSNGTLEHLQKTIQLKENIIIPIKIIKQVLQNLEILLPKINENNKQNIPDLIIPEIYKILSKQYNYDIHSSDDMFECCLKIEKKLEYLMRRTNHSYKIMRAEHPTALIMDDSNNNHYYAKMRQLHNDMTSLDDMIFCFINKN